MQKRQVSKPYLTQDLLFKCKLEDKFEEKNWKNTRNQQNLQYEPTNISNAYDSEYWQWKRAREYWREIEDIDWDKAIKEAKLIMDS